MKLILGYTNNKLFFQDLFNQILVPRVLSRSVGTSKRWPWEWGWTVRKRVFYCFKITDLVDQFNLALKFRFLLVVLCIRPSAFLNIHIFNSSKKVWLLFICWRYQYAFCWLKLKVPGNDHYQRTWLILSMVGCKYI